MTLKYIINIWKTFTSKEGLQKERKKNDKYIYLTKIVLVILLGIIFNFLPRLLNEIPSCIILKNINNLFNYQIIIWIYIGFFIASIRSIIKDLLIKKDDKQDDKQKRRICDLFPIYFINYPFTLLVSSLVISHIIPLIFNENLVKIEAEITLALIMGFACDNMFNKFLNPDI